MGSQNSRPNIFTSGWLAPGFEPKGGRVQFLIVTMFAIVDSEIISQTCYTGRPYVYYLSLYQISHASFQLVIVIKPYREDKYTTEILKKLHNLRRSTTKLHFRTL